MLSAVERITILDDLQADDNSDESDERVWVMKAVKDHNEHRSLERRAHDAFISFLDLLKVRCGDLAQILNDNDGSRRMLKPSTSPSWFSDTYRCI